MSKHLKLDEKYNPIVKRKDAYSDPMSETITQIVELKKAGVLDDKSANLLINIVVKKEMREEVKNISKFFIPKQQKETCDHGAFGSYWDKDGWTCFNCRQPYECRIRLDRGALERGANPCCPLAPHE